MSYRCHVSLIRRIKMNRAQVKSMNCFLSFFSKFINWFSRRQWCILIHFILEQLVPIHSQNYISTYKSYFGFGHIKSIIMLSKYHYFIVSLLHHMPYMIFIFYSYAFIEKCFSISLHIFCQINFSIRTPGINVF